MRGAHGGFMRRRRQPRLLFHSRVGRVWVVLAASLLAVLARGAVAQVAPSGDDARYFEQHPTWRLDWGTDTAVTLSNHERPSTNQTNDGTTNFDPLWVRLYGRLTYGERFEVVIDGFATDHTRPARYGLYLRWQPWDVAGLRVGQIPLVVGAWQERAYPHLQALVNQPLGAQFLLPLRSDSVPASVEELLAQRGRGRATRYALGRAGAGGALALAYEHCWDTGLEVFGRLRRVRYRLALTDGTPSASAAKARDHKSGVTWQGRFTWSATEWLRLGASWARGPYLLDDVGPFLPPGRAPRDYRQELWGADLRLRRGALELHGEWLHNRFDSPFIAGALRSDGLSAEADYRLAPGLMFAARWSRLSHGDVRDAQGRRWSWDAGAERLESGLAYRFAGQHLALKGVVQRTRVRLAPRRDEDLAALQLSFSR